MNYKKSVKRSYRLLKSVASKSENAEYLWLYDNFYIFSRGYRASRVSYEGELDQKLFSFCLNNDYSLSEEMIISFCREHLCEGNALFLYSLCGLLCGNAIIGAASAIKKGTPEFLSSCVTLIRTAMSLSVQELFSECWPPEKRLLSEIKDYAVFDDASKDVCRSYVAEYAKKKCISESEAVSELCGRGLCESINRRSYALRRALYFSFCLIGASAAVYAVSVLCGAAAFIAFLPTYTVFQQIADIFLSRLKKPFLFRINPKKFPKTAVVVSTLLFGEDKDEEVFENLLQFSLSNPDENLCFCLLADLPDGKNEHSAGDEAAVAYAKKRIGELNRAYGNKFCMLLRPRRYSERDGVYCGYERKRGAVCELVRYIKEGSCDGFLFGCDIANTEYICALDRDTLLPMNGVKELLEVALHPANRKYHLFQPSMHTTLESAYKTDFSRLISGEDCGDSYAAFIFDRSSALFGNGSFCGKGLIEVEAFYDKVIPAIPEGKVLSHDIVEGEILSTLYVPDVSFFDSCPASPAPFCKRLHRWVRGDMQNLIFLFDNRIPLSGRYKLWSNVRRLLSSVLMLFSIVISALTVKNNAFLLFMLSTSPLYMPCLITVLNALFSRSVTVVRYFSSGLTVLSQAVGNALWNLCFAAADGMIKLDGMIRALCRMVSGKRTLEWTTAFQSEKTRGGTFGARSFLLGTALLVFSKSVIFSLCGIAFMLYPLALRAVSKKIPPSRGRLNKQDKEYLKEKAFEIWSFFAENVGESTNGLPPDNIQYSPCYKVAYRTSPTNIGFYLVSALAAADLGFISSEEMLSRIEKAVSAIEQMPKYRNMLYNWYDIKTLSPLDMFVSSVDQGNFVCCVCALRQGLKEYGNERASALERRLEKIEKCDLSIFKDEKKKLLSLGITDGKVLANCYDRLMSEFRLTSYYAVASAQVDKKYWYSASRSCGSKNGYIGMLSWAGTSFEYFMPQLFLPRVQNSFIDESLMFAYKLQSERRIKSLWGISESAYYAFDCDMNYAYRAHGVKGLAIKNYDFDCDVLSPYSVYLTLCLGKQESVRTLKRYEESGFEGRHGLYEAASCVDGTLMAVRSYMSHHMGMSLIACANAICGDIFVKRFISEIRMRSAVSLLRERVPKEVQVYSSEISKKSGKKLYADISSADITLISRGSAAAICDAHGHISLSWGDNCICFGSYGNSVVLNGLCIRFYDGNYSYGCADGYGDGVYSHTLQVGSASYISASRAFTGSVRVTASDNAGGFFISCGGDNRKSFRVTLSLMPVLDKLKDFEFHPTYGKLFITSVYDDRDNALYFINRRRGLVMCAAPKDRHLPISFATSKEGLNAYSCLSVEDIDAIVTDNKCGTAVNPICLIRTDFIRGGRAVFIITCGASISEARQNLHMLRKEKIASDGGNSVSDALSLMLSAVSMPIPIEEGRCISISKNVSMWKYGISGDSRILTLIASEGSGNALSAFLSAFAAMKRGFVKCELVIVVSDSDIYNRPLEAEVRRRCEMEGIAYLIGQRGGIFILREEPEASFSTLKIDLSAPYIDLDVPKFKPDTVYRAGKGEEKCIISYDGCEISGETKMPYSWCLGNSGGFGSIVTNRSLGYSFFENCREKRICFFPHDPYGGEEGERIAVGDTDLCASASSVSFTMGRAVYRGKVDNSDYSVTVFVCGEENAKLYSVSFSSPIHCRVRLELIPCGQNGLKSACIAEKACGGAVFAQKFYDSAPLYAFASGGECEISGEKIILKSSGDSVFVLSAAYSAAKACEAGVHALQSVSKQLSRAEDFAMQFIPKKRTELKNPELSLMANLFLPYQTGMCRFVCRGSFYQAGGAYGFRDQLQDCMALVYTVPQLVRGHIIECCRHQYTEGDVMHWWHSGIGGVRTRCGDDRLFLPLAAAEYIRVTGDTSVLDERACFLCSEPLTGETDSRYEQERFTAHTDTVAEHCLLAFRSIETGKDGLASMGSCDWNDAFSEMGGQSMLTSLLFVWAEKEFSRYCFDAEVRKKSISLLESSEKFFFGGRYARAKAKDGTVYGTDGCGECEVDCAVQALAVFAGAKHGAEAAKYAYEHLFDEKNSIMLLLSPPFDKGKAPAGDIRKYPPGIRENGGQYTHAAVWLARALFLSGENDKAKRLTLALCPLLRASDARYKVEPYVMPADIYYADGLVGRGGWTWYTGASAWYYKLLTENYKD